MVHYQLDLQSVADKLLLTSEEIQRNQFPSQPSLGGLFIPYFVTQICLSISEYFTWTVAFAGN